MQQQAMSSSLSGIASMGYPPDHLQTLEKELATVKSELQVRLYFFPVLSKFSVELAADNTSYWQLKCTERVTNETARAN